MIDFIIGIIGMVFILTAFILDEFVKRFNQQYSDMIDVFLAQSE